MNYKFKYTERNVARGSEFETRALLHLITLSKKHKEIKYIFIDCFNDVTGTQENCRTLFDIQSKGVANLTPRKIGTSLITLYENSLTDFNFSEYSLFFPQVDEKYVADSTLRVFGFENFGIRIDEIFEGLITEYLRRNAGVARTDQLEKSIREFIETVVFVCDHADNAEYIKALASFKDKELKRTEFYQSVFDEIRQIQMVKKRINIESKEIAAIHDALAFEKHLKTKDINALVINRLIGVDVFRKKSIPPAFLDQVRALDQEAVKDLILDCTAKLSKALFDKNSKQSFWDFLEAAISEVDKSPMETAERIYSNIESTKGNRCRYMQGVSGIFLIALIKEGVEN